MGLPFKLLHLLIKLKQFCCLLFVVSAKDSFKDSYIFDKTNSIQEGRQRASQKSTNKHRVIETEERDRERDREREIANVCCRARERAAAYRLSLDSSPSTWRIRLHLCNTRVTAGSNRIRTFWLSKSYNWI